MDNNLNYDGFGSRAVALARSRKDVVVLSIILLILFCAASGYGIISLVTAIITDKGGANAAELVLAKAVSGFMWLVALIVILVITMVVVRLLRQQMLASALNVRYSDLAWLQGWVQGVAKDLSMPPLEVFIIQEPYLNAFAFGFINPYCIVLHSATVERLTDEELKAIVCHEMAHIRYRHTNISVYIAPLSAIPVVGVFVSWLFGFWSRRTELTCDRLAVAYLGNSDAMFRALLKVHMGPDVAKRANIEGLWAQLSESSTTFNKFAESLGSHPFLVRRALNIYNFSVQHGIPWYSTPNVAAGTVDKP